jgi:hypothetical protein
MCAQKVSKSMKNKFAKLKMYIYMYMLGYLHKTKHVMVCVSCLLLIQNP